MTYTDFRKEVAGFMNRSQDAFVINSFDILARAVNKARLWAERKHNFELSRISVSIPSVSLTDGGDLTTAVDVADLTTPVVVKLIERGFIPFQDSSGNYFPIQVISRDTHMSRLQRRYENMVSNRMAEASPATLPAQFAIVRQANKIYLMPAYANAYGLNTTVINVRLDVVRFQPDYDASTHPTDFFLTYCEDFMLLRSIVELNFFLKEDQRIPISAAALKDSWESVLAWDASIVRGSSDDSTME